jgi:hypothetical protein
MVVRCFCKEVEATNPVPEKVNQSFTGFVVLRAPTPMLRGLSSKLRVEFIGQPLRLSSSDERVGGVGREGARNLAVSANEAFNEIAAYLALYDNVSDVELDSRLHGI